MIGRRRDGDLGGWGSMRARARAEGWRPARGWVWSTVAVVAWFALAVQLGWWARWLWRRDVDVVAQGRAVLDGDQVDVAAWVAALAGVVGLIALLVYLVPMCRLAGSWWPERPWRAFREPDDVDGDVVVVRAPRTYEPWRRSPREIVWIPAGPAAAAPESETAAAVVPEPAEIDDGDTDEHDDAAVADDVVEADEVVPEPAEPRAAAKRELPQEPEAVQAALELPESEGEGVEAFLLRMLTPMPRLHPAIRETIVFAALNGGVIRLKEMMRELGLRRDAARRRCKRAAGDRWLDYNEDGTFKLSGQVITDLELLRRCAARGDEAGARAIAGEIRSRPLPQVPEDWLDVNSPNSYRELLARQAQDALTECIEAFGDPERLFERATDACWGD